MNKPLLRAEGIISNEEKTKFLVQCDLEESFYRFPGGSIEFGETASDAIKRELIEEFDLKSKVGELACVNESIVEYDGKKRHDCTLIHWCSVVFKDIQGNLMHKERPEVKLIWRTLNQLKNRPTYPEGILDVIASNKNHITHILIEKIYE
ncbi:DNA mismatch repair protein MutT [Bacillus sp. FJAT-22090]|uniref:NUDIX domain-containing protein n=1 Tax=Bacillus sp. FJAT-22090 TaxID=1581038 RepID=UPI0006AFB68C|nr:NUDIX domain-containing protein [Bacillus sp. FJAT-22090]ALC85271.1 DNA mismatch repair protein MutT [Bacillus sp. FJAT-22090]